MDKPRLIQINLLPESHESGIHRIASMDESTDSDQKVVGRSPTLLDVIEQPLILTGFFTIGGIVGALLFTPAFILCAVCILLGIHRSKICANQKWRVQILAYCLSALLLAVSGYFLNDVLDAKLDEIQTAFAKKVASYISKQPKPDIKPDDLFTVSVEFARISVGGRDYGTSLWIRYPSRDGGCGSLSPIQGMYFVSITNKQNVPASVVGYGMDVWGTPLVRVRTKMGNIVGTPNVIDGHFLHPQIKFKDIKVGQYFDFGQGPGFSMATVPLNQSDFAHGIVLKMDLIDDLLQHPLQPGIPIRGWAFFQPPNENAPTIAGLGHVTLETDNSHTLSYAFDLKNPRSDLDNLQRIITVESFVDLSGCGRL
jgi:hypothetical protein